MKNVIFVTRLSQFLCVSLSVCHVHLVDSQLESNGKFIFYGEITLTLVNGEAMVRSKGQKGQVHMALGTKT